MPVFVYRAADRRGQKIDGVMEASDARAVVERLQRDAYFPIRVAPHAERRHWLSLGGSGRVGQRDLLAFTQQLATLFEATLPLDRALVILEELAPNGHVKAIVADLLVSVRGGASLSEALAKHHPRPFSRLYINMIRAGERGGVLELTLRRAAGFLEARAAFADAVVTAVAYPAVVFTFGIGAIIFLMTFVIPRFATIFADLGQTIPLPTQILLWVSAGFQAYWWVGVIVILAGVLAWRVWTASPQGRVRWDQTVLGLPLIGPLAMKIETARFARTLGTMLKSGVPVLSALAVVGGSQAGDGRREQPIDARRLAGLIVVDQRRYTLIELLVVIIVLGLLVGLVGPRLFGRVGQSKQAAARAQIELLGAALDQYRLDIGSYPSGGQGLDALQRNPNVNNWNGPYLKKAVPKDPWGNQYKYRCCPGQNGEYDLWSEGADGAPGGDGENADITSWDNSQK